MKAGGNTWRPSARLIDVDVGLELAIEALRNHCRHLPHGLLRLELERDGGATVDYRIERDSLTAGDYERLMREPPRGKKEGS